MVNQTCPMRYLCEILPSKLKCDGCGWCKFDFTKIDISEIERILVEIRECGNK